MSLNILPPELIYVIFKELKPKKMLKFALVSKRNFNIFKLSKNSLFLLEQIETYSKDNYYLGRIDYFKFRLNKKFIRPFLLISKKIIEKWELKEWSKHHSFGYSSHSRVLLISVGCFPRRYGYNLIKILEESEFEEFLKEITEEIEKNTGLKIKKKK